MNFGYQSSSLLGTSFENTKLSLTVWILAIYLMTQSKNAVSALELKHQLGVRYKTAWLIKQRHSMNKYHVIRNGRLAVQHPEFQWVPTALLSNLKTVLSGTSHTFNHIKYTNRYLAEFSYRFNRRFELVATVT